MMRVLPNGEYFGLAFMQVVSIVLNFAAAMTTMDTFSDLYTFVVYCNRRPHTLGKTWMLLFSPHWMVGVVIPIWVAYSQGRSVERAVYFFEITVVAPYFFAYWCWYLQERDDNTAATDTTELPLKATEGLVFTTVVGVQGCLSSNTTTTNNNSTTSVGEGKDDLKCYRYRAVHPSHPVTADTTKLNTGILEDEEDHDTESGTTSSMTGDENGEYDTSSNDVYHDTKCTICSNLYQAEDVVSWSPNPVCHHAFHKHCALERFASDPLCPICEQDYLFLAPTTNTETTG